MAREHGAEESNLGSMEQKGVLRNHGVLYHVYTVEIFAYKNTPSVHFRTDFNSGSKFTNVQGAGRYQNRVREHEKLFWGASR